MGQCAVQPVLSQTRADLLSKHHVDADQMTGKLSRLVGASSDIDEAYWQTGPKCRRLPTHFLKSSQFTIMRFQSRNLRFINPDPRLRCRKTRFRCKRRLQIETDIEARAGVARKSSQQRAIEQRDRSKRDRKAAVAIRKPSRDDIARTALWLYIRGAWLADKNPRELLDIVRNNIVDQLVAQGFDLRQSEERFEELAQKYKSALPPFRIKRHLQKRRDATSAGTGDDSAPD
jgi:hypothetical protein